MKLVSDIILENKHSLPTTNPDTSVYDGLVQLTKSDQNALLVIENDRLIGVFTERDYTRKVELAEKPAKTTPIREVMTKNLILVAPDTPLEECLELMNSHQIRHLPVVTREGALVAFISVLDVVNSILHEKQNLISSLEDYVSNAWPF